MPRPACRRESGARRQQLGRRGRRRARQSGASSFGRRRRGGAGSISGSGGAAGRRARGRRRLAGGPHRRRGRREGGFPQGYPRRRGQRRRAGRVHRHGGIALRARRPHRQRARLRLEGVCGCAAAPRPARRSARRAPPGRPPPARRNGAEIGEFRRGPGGGSRPSKAGADHAAQHGPNRFRPRPGAAPGHQHGQQQPVRLIAQPALLP